MRPRLNGEHAAGTTSTTINTLYSSGPFLVETKKYNRGAAVEEKAQWQENSSLLHPLFPTTAFLSLLLLHSKVPTICDHTTMVANYFQSKRAHSAHKYERKEWRSSSKEVQHEYETC